MKWAWTNDDAKAAVAVAMRGGVSARMLCRTLDDEVASGIVFREDRKWSTIVETHLALEARVDAEINDAMDDGMSDALHDAFRAAGVRA